MKVERGMKNYLQFNLAASWIYGWSIRYESVRCEHRGFKYKEFSKSLLFKVVGFTFILESTGD